jgi:hypothetical protein
MAWREGEKPERKEGRKKLDSPPPFPSRIQIVTVGFRSLAGRVPLELSSWLYIFLRS